MTRFGYSLTAGIIQLASRPARPEGCAVAGNRAECIQSSSVTHLFSRVAVPVAVVTGLVYCIYGPEFWEYVATNRLQSISSAAPGFFTPFWAKWPWPIRVRPTARFRALHPQIKRELRATREELDESGQPGRSLATRIEARVALELQLEKIGVRSPHNQGQHAWFEFLVVIADLSQRRRLRQARAAFPVTDSVTELESEDVIAIHPDDFEEGLAPARDSAEVFLAQCQNRVLSQERFNRECAVKAMGIVTFAASMLVFGVDWGAWPESSILERLLGFALAASVLSIITSALSVIIRPRGWWNACDLGKIEMLALNARNDADSVKLIRAIAASHQTAIQENEKVLTNKAACLTFMTFTAMLPLFFLCLLKFLV